MVKERLTLDKPERWSKPHTIAREKLEAAAKAACDKLKANTEKYGLGFPGTCSVNYKYVRGANNNWECGMYTGCYWLAYEISGDEFFKDCAEKMLETYYERVDKKIGVDDHDVGFVFSPSCVAAYKITGNEEAKKKALEIFDYYYERSYTKEGKFIIRSHRGWRNGSMAMYRTMMDSLMNAPLLFWASEVTGNPEYKQSALDHVRTTEQLLIRENGSSFHHYQFDPVTSAPMHGVTLQGRADDSTWGRGHSWGVYGFPIAYSYAPEAFIKEVHRNVTYFMLNRLPSDCVPMWDYDFLEGDDQPRDASCGAISCCGLNEMAKMLPDTDENKAIFESAAAQMLEGIIDNCTGDIGVEYDGLICHVTHALPQGQGIDECAVYGDYFYLEALARYLKPDFKKYW